MPTYAIAATPPITHLEGETDACAAARRTPWIIAGILAGFAALLAVLYAVVAEHTDAGAAIRHLLLGAITALTVLAGATPIAGAAIRPMIERQIRAQAALNDCLRREAQAAAEIALLRSTVSTIAVCGSRLAELPQDVSRDVAAQIRPLAERVTAVEETMEDMSTAAAIVSQAASANGRVTPLRAPDGHRRSSG